MYLVPKIVENKRVQKMPEKALTILELKLDEYIAEMTQEKIQKKDKHD